MSNALTTVSPNEVPQSSAFSGKEAFAVAQRVGQALASSSIVPKDYQGNVANVMVAMEYAHRIGASVLAVMQNLDVIHGRPSLRATFLIATVNASGRFTPLRFRWQGEEGADSWGCRAVATDRESGEECIGPLITIELAKGEGWVNKSGSKWKTLPELMLMYRSAAFWTRVYAPEISLGLHTTDELEDAANGRMGASAGAVELNAALSDPIQSTPPATQVEDAQVVGQGGGDQDDARTRLHGQYFAMLAERGIQGDEDRHALQARLHKDGLVSSESCMGWNLHDYRSAIAELGEIPVLEGAES
jgi:hypothetical protein